MAIWVPVLLPGDSEQNVNPHFFIYEMHKAAGLL